MASRSLKATLGLLLASGTLAQSTETVWSSFAFVLHGERTPLRGKLEPSLTPLGAQQLYSQGQLFRARYLSNSSLSDADNSLTTNSPIVGLEREALDNTQLSVSSSTDSFVTGSALAFMQGLYPPVTQSFAYNNGGVNASTLANGTQINYPLDGYQYPSIQTLSATDPNSVWLEGHAGCTQYWVAGADFQESAAARQRYNATLDFYQKTWAEVFPNTLPKAALSYDNAYDLYDYAQYAYDHDAAARDALGAARLALLRAYADEQQLALNGGGDDGDGVGDAVAVAGRTLAGKVVAQLSTHIASGGSSNKLTVMFGSLEPFMSFFALSGLAALPTTTAFTRVPQPGAVMAFELFSNGDNANASSFPSRGDLWVRFVYRNGTGADAPFAEYPLFGRGNSAARMPYADFVDGVNAFAIKDVSSWCDACDAVTLFCGALSDNAEGGSGSDSDSLGGANGDAAATPPPVAGVIGAVVTLAVLGLAAVAAFVFGGLRLRRAEDAGRHRSSLGGFKGSEKMASDHDVSIVKSGARHERVGSWELGGPGASPAAAAGGAEGVFGASVRRKGDDDGDSIAGRAPVKPVEGV
ncbi:phosphoglycerate mutase-like protein [Xylariaceae sp. FL0662B]|nr:phosphoglycerate mutase-like protein [Xylariaceae sp. FL0662B]